MILIWYDLVSKLFLGSVIVLFHIIIVDGFVDFVKYKLNGAIYNTEENVTNRIFPMFILVQSLRVNNPRKVHIDAHIYDQKSGPG